MRALIQVWCWDRRQKIRTVPRNPRPTARSTYIGTIPLVLYPSKTSQQEERGSRREEGMRSHVLCGPGVNVGGYYPPRLHCHSQSFPSSVRGFGWHRSCEAHPHPTSASATETGRDPAWPSGALHLPTRGQLRQMRLKPGTYGGSFGENEALIQWGSLALGTMSEWRVQKSVMAEPAKGKAD